MNQFFVFILGFLLCAVTSCDKDDQPQVYFDSNECEYRVPLSDFAHVYFSWDGHLQRVDTVLYGVNISPSFSELYALSGITLSASCNINQLWTLSFSQLSVDLDTLEFCPIENSCSARYLDIGEVYFNFGVLNFDEIRAYYTPIQHPSNFFYIEQKGDEGSDMIFSYKVHLKQNGSSIAADIYPDTLIMETTDATAFYETF